MKNFRKIASLYVVIAVLLFGFGSTQSVYSQSKSPYNGRTELLLMIAKRAYEVGSGARNNSECDNYVMRMKNQFSEDEINKSWMISENTEIARISCYAGFGDKSTKENSLPIILLHIEKTGQRRLSKSSEINEMKPQSKILKQIKLAIARQVVSQGYAFGKEARDKSKCPAIVSVLRSEIEQSGINANEEIAQGTLGLAKIGCELGAEDGKTNGNRLPELLTMINEIADGK